MLDLQPTLVGENITLRPLRSTDYDRIFAAASDPLIWAQHPDPGRGTLEGFPPFFRAALDSQSCLVVLDEASGSLLGWSRYSNYFPGDKVTIGWTFLVRSHWGGPTNAEMKRLMLQYAFTDVPAVLFTVAEHNLRSRRAVEKLGAELIGAEDALRWGQTHVIYRLTRELWERTGDRARELCGEHE